MYVYKCMSIYSPPSPSLSFSHHHNRPLPCVPLSESNPVVHLRETRKRRGSFVVSLSATMSACKDQDPRIHGIKTKIRVVPNFPKPGFSSFDRPFFFVVLFGSRANAGELKKSKFLSAGFLLFYNPRKQKPSLSSAMTRTTTRIMFQDITTLLLDPKAFKDTIDLFVERYKGKNITVVADILEVTIFERLRDELSLGHVLRSDLGGWCGWVMDAHIGESGPPPRGSIFWNVSYVVMWTFAVFLFYENLYTFLESSLAKYIFMWISYRVVPWGIRISMFFAIVFSVDVLQWSIEARGFIFGPPIALAIGAKFVPLRKPRKLPGEVISEEYILEYGRDCLEMHVGAVEPGDCALVVDDLIATGGTLCAAMNLLGNHFVKFEY
ncbi:Adenine phosphoribosyltransferase 3 [Vitis vinifera]|uniref:adenine phosphoribosyltransferase n=1 Tax=Vitis vinifera TaxID=29760 RepID=A0A438K2V9_VITVI|nr:Adenine phosphoribosyltransferase 3 [Vitis vinifera]